VQDQGGRDDGRDAEDDEGGDDPEPELSDRLVHEGHLEEAQDPT